jgi:alpha-L-fucosidase
VPYPGTSGKDVSESLQHGDRDGTIWRPGESDVSIRPGWFWHASQDSKVRSVENLVDLYFKSVGRNSLLLLNVPPNTKGLLSDPDVTRLAEFRAALAAIFKTNLAAGATIHASNIRAGAGNYGPAQALDASPDTYWATDDAQTSAWLEIHLDRPVEFNVVMIQEAIALGQRVEGWQLGAWRNGKWEAVVRGTTIGHKRLERFEPLTAQRVRLVIAKAKACPLVGSFGLYNAPGLK